MIKVLFVCLGNICRSPMAEGIFKQMLEHRGLDTDFFVASRATSNYEIGNSPHQNTRRILEQMNIDHSYMKASRITESDFFEFDYIIGMDSDNLDTLNSRKPVSSKARIFRLLDFAATSRKDIADPWYTKNFEVTKKDIELGLLAFLEYIKNN